MSRQYDRLIMLFESDNVSTVELRRYGRGDLRADLIGENDIA